MRDKLMKVMVADGSLNAADTRDGKFNLLAQAIEKEADNLKAPK